MLTSHQDTPGSIRLKLDSFFLRCPDGDYLTAEDAAAKFGVDLSWAYKTLKGMVSEGILETTMVQSRKMKRQVVAYRAVVVQMEVPA